MKLEEIEIGMWVYWNSWYGNTWEVVEKRPMDLSTPEDSVVLFNNFRTRHKLVSVSLIKPLK